LTPYDNKRPELTYRLTSLFFSSFYRHRCTGGDDWPALDDDLFYFCHFISTFMSAALFVITGMIAFGFSNVCWKPLLNYYSPFHALFLRSLFTVVLISISAACLLINSKHLQTSATLLPKDTGWTASICPSIIFILISLAGLVLFVKSVQYSKVSISGLLICCSSFFSALLAWWLRSEGISFLLACSFVFNLCGIAILDDWRNLKNTSIKGVALALSGAACWAVANIGFKKNITELGVLPFSFLQELTVCLLAGCATGIQSYFHPAPIKRPGKLPFRLILMISCCTLIGVFCTNLAIEELPLVLFSLLLLAQPLTTLLTARLWMKESLTWKQYAGAALVLIGVFLALIQG
jgi:drug/metabolite transporter (DMT)-like permease